MKSIFLRVSLLTFAMALLTTPSCHRISGAAAKSGLPPKAAFAEDLHLERLERNLHDLQSLTGDYRTAIDLARKRHELASASLGEMKHTGESEAQKIVIADTKRELDEALARQQDADHQEGALQEEIRIVKQSREKAGQIADNTQQKNLTAAQTREEIDRECSNVKRLLAEIETLGSPSLQTAAAEARKQYRTAIDRLRELDEDEEVSRQKEQIDRARQEFDQALERKKQAQARSQELLAEIEQSQQHLDRLLASPGQRS